MISWFRDLGSSSDLFAHWAECKYDSVSESTFIAWNDFAPRAKFGHMTVFSYPVVVCWKNNRLQTCNLQTATEFQVSIWFPGPRVKGRTAKATRVLKRLTRAQARIKVGEQAGWKRTRSCETTRRGFFSEVRGDWNRVDRVSQYHSKE